jgi:ADP-ribosylglycohydrolase
MSREEILKKFGPAGITSYVPAYGRVGAITDDTQMTLFTAEGLLRGHVRALMRGTFADYTGVTAHALQRWLLTQGQSPSTGQLASEDGWLIQQRDLHHQRAPGMTCLNALRNMPDFATPADNDSKGCGGVMRVAPVGMFAASVMGHLDDDRFATEVFRLGVENAALTHGHISGQLPAGVLSLAIALILRGSSVQEALLTCLGVLEHQRSHEETAGLLEKAIDLAAASPAQPEALALLGEGWVAEEALAISAYCALSTSNFEEAVALAVNHDGDSDSTGAITGNLLGAALGKSAIPELFIRDLELHDVIEEIADDLATANQWQLSEYSSGPEIDYYWNKYPGD